MISGASVIGIGGVKSGTFRVWSRAQDKKIANRKIGVRNATSTNWAAEDSAQADADQPPFPFPMTDRQSLPSAVHDSTQNQRLSTGIPGLDQITEGGLLTGGIYLVAGNPGAGKTILANQAAFAHARNGGRVVYATLLSETHARLLGQVRRLSFFSEAAVGQAIFYLNGLGAVQKDGLDGLLKAIQRMVRDHRADLVVLDGMLHPSQLGVPDLDYKRFIASLQEWIALVGATVLIVTTSAVGGMPAAEQTMVDGMIELTSESREMRRLRTIAIVKYRGSGFSEGRHAYRITADGIDVFPRLEVTLRTPDHHASGAAIHAPTGIPGFDDLLGGGLLEGSATLLLGSAGSGKTTAGLQILTEGARRGERGLFFGFFETPASLLRKGDRLGLDLARHQKEGLVHLEWSDTGEPMLDRTLHHICQLARTKGAKRVVVDGLAGLRMADYPERLSSAFTVFANHLAVDGITLVITDETRELFIRDVSDPTQHVSTLFQNILLLRTVELDAELRRLVSVLKTRDADHDRRLWEFSIGNEGIALTAPFRREARSLMTGNATSDVRTTQTVASEPKQGSS